MPPPGERLTADEIAADDARGAAAAAARQQARADLDRLDRLPELHAAALLRSAGFRERSVNALRERLESSPLTIIRYEQTPGAAQTIEQQIAAAARRLDEIAPPETECSPVGAELVRGDEDEIHAAAERQAQEWAEIYAAAPQLHAAEPWIRAERSCPRWQRRRLRREALRAQSYYDTALRLARPGSRYVSDYTLAAWRDRQTRSQNWAAGIDVTFDDGSSVPLTDVQDNARKARRAQLYAMVKAMEHTGKTLNYTAFFVTLTLPGEYHAVSSGAADPDGEYRRIRENADWTPAHGPRAQIAELNRRWALIRARLAKFRELRQYFGILVPEPHQSGTPHLHAMIWLPTRYTRGERERPTRNLLRRILREIAPRRESKLDVIEKAGPNTSSPASYVMKYVLKSLGNEGEDAPDHEAPDGEEHLVGEAHERYRAWNSARGIRRMRLLGVHGGIRVWQRLWTASDDEDLPDRAARARAALRTGQAAGEQAKASDDPAEIARLREQQAAAFAEALGIMGALPHLGDGGRLKLSYEEGETEYGRPSRRPVAIVDTETDESFPLKLREARLVPREAANDNPSADGKPLEKKAVTVAAIVPRDGAPPRPAADDPDDEAHAATLEALIAARQTAPPWSEWCERMREKVRKLRAGTANGNELTDAEAA